MGNPFEQPKTPADIAQLMKTRESSDAKLQEGGAQDKGKGLEITGDQFEAAKKEMDTDSESKKMERSQSPEEKEQEVKDKIAKLEAKR